MDTDEEIVRLLVMQLRGEKFGSQADAIRALRSAGFGPSRIAELLGTTTGTVNVTLAKAKRREGRKPPKTQEGAADE